MNTIQTLIHQKKPFCIVCTNSILGATKFIACLDSKGERETIEMTKEDVFTMRQGITQQLYERVDLGEKGTVYEFKERPFRPYCQQARTGQRTRNSSQDHGQRPA